MAYEVRNIAKMADDELARRKDVLSYFRISQATLHNWRTRKGFPKPINGNAPTPYWRAGDVKAYRPGN